MRQIKKRVIILLKTLYRLPRYMAWGAIRVYQWCLSPWLGRACRFQPTCSHFGQEALLKHGFIKGSLLTFWRVCRCQPLGGCGIDPVPEKWTDYWKPRKPHNAATTTRGQQ